MQKIKVSGNQTPDYFKTLCSVYTLENFRGNQNVSTNSCVNTRCADWSEMSESINRSIVWSSDYVHAAPAGPRAPPQTVGLCSHLHKETEPTESDRTTLESTQFQTILLHIVPLIHYDNQHVNNTHRVVSTSIYRSIHLRVVGSGLVRIMFRPQINRSTSSNQRWFICLGAQRNQGGNHILIKSSKYVLREIYRN